MPVECRSDTEYAERPLAFTWQEQRLEIQDILQSWRTPNGKRFRVLTADDQIFDLIFDETTAEWQIHQP